MKLADFYDQLDSEGYKGADQMEVMDRPEISRHITQDGNTELTISNLGQRLAREALDAMGPTAKVGRPPVGPKLQVRLREQTIARLDEISRQAGTDRSTLVRTLVETGLTMHPAEAAWAAIGAASMRAPQTPEQDPARWLEYLRETADLHQQIADIVRSDRMMPEWLVGITGDAHTLALLRIDEWLRRYPELGKPEHDDSDDPAWWSSARGDLAGLADDAEAPSRVLVEIAAAGHHLVVEAVERVCRQSGVTPGPGWADRITIPQDREDLWGEISRIVIQES